MKVAFLIDGPQTYQAVARLIRTFVEEGHECVTYATYESVSMPNSEWKMFRSRTSLIENFLKEKGQYQKTFGINMFNDIWSDMYQKDSKDTYALEYCWNELYNGKQGFGSHTMLFANSEWSKSALEDLTGYGLISCLGSPWFELISEFRKEKAEDYVVFMAPHNSYFQKFPDVGATLLHFLHNLREYTNKMGLKLVLKTRRKYGSRLISLGTFDKVVSDTDPFTHLELYSKAKAVFHFCSSSLMELAFLEVPSVSLYPELHRKLHIGDKFEEPVKVISDRYYNGDMHDLVHSYKIGYTEYTDYELLKAILDSLTSEKNWDRYKADHFPGNHIGASKRIVDFVSK